jgi:hypothetical protein
MAKHKPERIRQHREHVVLVDGETADYVADQCGGCADDEEGHVHHICAIVVAEGHRTLAHAMVALRDCSGREVRLTRRQAADFLWALDSDVKLDLMVAAGLTTNARISRAIDAEADRPRSHRGLNMDRVYADVVCPVAAVVEPRTARRRVFRRAARARRPSCFVSVRSTARSGDSPGSPPAGNAPSSPHSALAGEAVLP